MDEDYAAAVAAGAALVAVCDDAIVGLATFKAMRPVAELTTVAVEPARHGEGIGTALIAAVEAHARAAGAERIALYTNALMTDNLARYPRLGYVETGRSEGSGFNRVNFEKVLAPAMATRGSVDGLYGRRIGASGARVDPDDPLLFTLDAPCDLGALFGPARAVRMEVGFGGGEHLIDHATREPHTGFIGVEPYETGLARAARAAHAAGLANVRLHQGDARLVLDWLPAGALERVDVLYPDPWHKQRHWKRRFISAPGLDRLARVLVPGGELRFASDIDSYVRWTRAHVAAHPEFALAGDSETPWPHWPGTRYEAKAIREGRPPRYLTITRR
ncbi:MAG: hypothetical protein AcusKO_48170 [Acuticoccus sp.]